VLAFGALSVACTASQAAGPAPATTPTATATAAATASATPAATASPPEPTATEPAIAELPPEAAPAEPPAAPAEPVRGGTVLAVPDGTTVVWGGCASDGTCYWYNFYWAPTHEVVMQAGEGQHKVQHELCHAHQHSSINGGAPLDPSDYDLESWYASAEGQSFSAAVASASGGWPWIQSAVSGLEDFAWTCGYWYFDPAYLLQMSPERYDWAAAHLP
jgi:hypothetical protein